MRTSTAPVADAADARDLQPIRLYLAEMVLIASVSPGDERMSDILNHGGELRVLPSGAEPWQPDSWVSVPIDEIEIVVPPRHVSPPHKRIERDRHPVRLHVGEWDVAGTAHFKPGSEHDAVLLSIQPFLPLRRRWCPKVQRLLHGMRGRGIFVAKCELLHTRGAASGAWS